MSFSVFHDFSVPLHVFGIVYAHFFLLFYMCFLRMGMFFSLLHMFSANHNDFDADIAPFFRYSH